MGNIVVVAAAIVAVVFATILPKVVRPMLQAVVAGSHMDCMRPTFVRLVDVPVVVEEVAAAVSAP